MKLRSLRRLGAAVFGVCAFAAIGAPSQSAATVGGAVAPEPPQNTSAPVMGGVLFRGGILSGHAGVWLHTPAAYTYTWYHCGIPSVEYCASTPVGVGPRYVVRLEDTNAYIGLSVTAANAGGTTQAPMVFAGPVGQPYPLLDDMFTNVAAPVISGNARVGELLDASEGLWKIDPPAASYVFHWFRCATVCLPITGAHSSQYLPNAADRGYRLAVEVLAVAATRSGVTSLSPRSALTTPVTDAATQSPALPNVTLDLGLAEAFDPWHYPDLGPPDLEPLSPIRQYALPLEQYAAAAAAPTRLAPGREPAASSVAAPQQLLNNGAPVRWSGIGQGEAGGRVPDPHGGVGTEYFFEVTNFRVQVFTKFGDETPCPNPNSGKRVATLQQFFNSSAPLVDPRAIKDPLSGHWFAVAVTSTQTQRDRLLESSTPQYLMVAMSRLTDARGRCDQPNWPSWIRFAPIPITDLIARDGSKGDWTEPVLDYPSLGSNNDDFMVTLNVAPRDQNDPQRKPVGVQNSAILFFPKSELFAAAQDGSTVHPHVQGFTTPDLPGFLTPPILRFQGPSVAFVAPVSQMKGAPGTNPSVLKVYIAETSSPPKLNPTPRYVPVEPYYIPSSVPQCPTGSTPNDPIDSSDTRFVNASMQTGAYIWQAHSVNRVEGSDDRATVRWYRINWWDATAESGTLHATATSSDWNASIAADESLHVFVNWNSADADGGCVPPRILAAGRTPNDPPGQMSAPVTVGTSQSWLDVEPAVNYPFVRWGDYSSTTIDPSVATTTTCAGGGTPSHRAWLVNELVGQFNSGYRAHFWDTDVVAIGYC